MIDRVLVEKKLRNIEDYLRELQAVSFRTLEDFRADTAQTVRGAEP
jgi:hypothetical protein